MQVNDFDYELPAELIAQQPTDRRDASRLLVADRENGRIYHRHFYDILDYLEPGDCLVMNDSKVIPARLFGIRETTGAKVEFLLIKRKKNDIWEVMVRPGKKVKPGDTIKFADDFKAKVLEFGPGGTRIVGFAYDGIFMERLEELGRMPLPPYIDRPAEEKDRERYQTVYCREEGSVAAPTAGLHFTREILEKARQKGVKLAYVTLHVGIGTFRPVKSEKVEDHQMHFEEYSIDGEAAETINETLSSEHRLIAVGTTSVRTLESAAVETSEGYRVAPGSGNTGIFIYPGYRFKIIDRLITNFHLPKSTLLMLVSAFYTREDILRIYEEAVSERYRFFSYGDAMLIL